MYLIKAGNLTIYDSRDKNTYPVIKPSINESLNEAGTLTFTLLPGHPYYDQMKKMQTFVTAYRDDRELFFGRVLITDKALDGQMEVTCEGGLTFLLDSEMEKGEYNESIVAFFTRIINNHNTQVEEIKRLTIGSITAAKALDTNKKYDFSLTSYQNTKEIIESMITGRFGGYVRIVPNGSGGHQIDYIEDYGRTNTQAVQVGHNIIDKSDHLSGEEMFTVLRPIGKSQPTGTAGESTDVTIESLSQSDITIPNVVKDGKLLKLTDKIAEYGIIRRTEQFNSAETPQDLLKKAEDYITRRGTQLPATCDINLVDFYHLNPTVMDVRLGDVFSSIEGFAGQVMTVGEMSIDLENPANDSIKLKNQEEINANRLDYNVEGAKKGTSSSSGLTSSSAKSSSQEQFRYKYYSERQDMALIHAKEVEINAENRFSALSSNIMLTIQEDPDKPDSGQFVLQARRHVDDPNGSILEMNVAGFKLQKTIDQGTDASLTIDGYSIASVVQKTGISDLGQNETLFSKITQTESAITTEVTDRQNADISLSSRITQTADAITTEVTNRQSADNTLSSRITQTADAIESRVEKNGVISAINQSAEEITINASRINLEGYVTADALKTSAVDISIIKLANYISGSDGQQYSPHFITLGGSGAGQVASQKFLGNSDMELDHSHSITATPNSNGTVTLTLGMAQSTAGTDSFNMADTTWYAGRVSAFKTAVSSALGSAAWSSSGSASTIIDVSLDTANKQLRVNSAIANITYPGDNKTTAVSIGLPGVLSFDTELTNYANAQKNAVKIVQQDAAGWVNGNYVVKTDAPTPKTYTVSLPSFQTSGGSTFTNHKTTVSFSTPSVSGPLANVVVDATDEYEDGQDSVNVVKGAWNGGRISFTTSQGSGAGTSVELSATPSWGDGYRCSVPIMDGGYSTGYTVDVNGYDNAYVPGWLNGRKEVLDARTTLSASSNGTYYPTGNSTGFSSVEVAVPATPQRSASKVEVTSAYATQSQDGHWYVSAKVTYTDGTTTNPPAIDVTTLYNNTLGLGWSAAYGKVSWSSNNKIYVPGSTYNSQTHYTVTAAISEVSMSKRANTVYANATAYAKINDYQVDSKSNNNSINV